MLKLIHQSAKLQRRIFHQYFEKFLLSLAANNTEKRRNIKNVKTVAAIENNARYLLKKLTRSKSTRVSLIQLEHLVHYMKIYPLARKQVFLEDGTTKLLKIQQKTRCQEIRKLTKIALGLIGHVDQVKGKGVRILSLDGGGTRCEHLLFIFLCVDSYFQRINGCMHRFRLYILSRITRSLIML